MSLRKHGCSAAGAAACALLALATPANARASDELAGTEWQRRDGLGNNVAHPGWGATNVPYRRSAFARYGDGRGSMVGGPSPRWLSNRIFDDRSQNVFSPRAVSQWGFVWGQFVDHTVGLRQEADGEPAPLPFSAQDPLERFGNTFGSIQFERTPAVPGTGVTSPREQRNTVGAYIDGSSVYGETPAREEWLREGPLDGNPANNGPHLLLTADGYLPHRAARGDPENAPDMQLGGRLQADDTPARVAGDVRANENVALQATHTLFAREHNRIVDLLPDDLPAERRFQIARRVVIAEQQAITFEEFLPAMGVELPEYEGYDPEVDAGLTNEFAVVGYRAHSMIHGELEPSAPTGTWSPQQLAQIERDGVEVESEDGVDTLVIPLNVAFFNPELLQRAGLGPILHGIGSEREYRNDEQVDDQLRSVLFQVPGPGATAAGCLDGTPLPQCFQGVIDLPAIDIQRGRDHGLPSYVQLRRAYGLEVPDTFADITDEGTEEWPDDDEVDASEPLDDPSILDDTELRDDAGEALEPGTEAADTTAVEVDRRTPLAARLKAVYKGDLQAVDAFVGMVSEPPAPGAELGRLQKAIWEEQFTALRDGDRFFYAGDPVLRQIKREFGVRPRHRLGEVIALNTRLDPDTIEEDVFRVAE